MTPEQALQILDQATALLQVNRQDQIQIMEALRVLKAAIEEKPTKPAK